jgi:hypothetical protein
VAQRGGVERARRSAMVASRRREILQVRHLSQPHLCVDRILVAPSGIYVVSTAAREVPKQRVPGEHGVGAAPTELERARAARRLIGALVQPRYRTRVRAVLCRPGETSAAEHAGVLVTSPETLEHVVQHAAVVLSTSEVHEVGMRLAALTEPFPTATPARPRRRWVRRLTAGGAAVAASCGGFLAAAQEGWINLW